MQNAGFAQLPPAIAVEKPAVPAPSNRTVFEHNKNIQPQAGFGKVNPRLQPELRLVRFGA